MDAEPTRPARVAAVQMSSGADPGENLASAARLLRLAAARGASVALLPENFSLMARRDADRRAHAEVDGSGPVQAFLADTARELKLWIIAGSVPITGEAGGRLAQSCLVYGADGARKARYDKIHLFDVDLPERQESYRESTHMAPGDSTLVIDTPAGRLGLSICYDVRFPELYRRLVVAGAQSGLHANGRRTWGHSLIIDFWGRILAQLPDGEGVITGEIDLPAQADARRSFPALAHRREGLFQHD